MDSGAHALWDMLDFEIPIDKKLIEKGTLMVIAKDKNIHKSDAIIGCGMCSLRRLANSIIIDKNNNNEIQHDGHEVELSIDFNYDSPGKPAKKGISHGRIVLYSDVGKKEQDESTMHHKPNFEYGLLNISKVRTFGLKNTELFSTFTDSRQDPYVKLKFNDWDDRTHTKDNAGGDVTWDFLDLECPLYTENILNNRLEIQVYDENRSRKDALIGIGSCSVLKATTIENIGKEVKLRVDLIDEEKKSSGKVYIYMTVTEPQIGGQIPDDFDLGILTIKKAKLVGLYEYAKNPLLTFHTNKSEEKTEQYLGKDADLDPQWDMNFKFEVDKHIVKGKTDLIVNVYNSNSLTGSSSLYGKAKIALKEAGITMNTDVNLSGVILSDQDKRLGRVVIRAQLNADVVKSLPIVDSLPPTFVTGTINVDKVKINSPKIFSNKKIYCRLEYGQWNECTGSQNATKGSSLFKLNMNIPTNKTLLGNEFIKLVILEEGSFTHGVRELAFGITNLKISHKICQNLKNKIEYDIDLFSLDKNVALNGEPIGRASFNSELTDIDMTPDNDDDLPDNCITLKTGVFQIHKVSAYDLVGGDLIGKQDPYVKFSIENIDDNGNDWHQQTENQQNAGRSAIWDSITDISAPVTSDTLLYKRLKVTVMDKNNYTSDAFMGMGDIGMRGAGCIPKEEKLLKVQLKNKNGKNAGHVEVLVCVYPDVDMSNGIDNDGDGIDDGIQNTKMNGILHFNSISIARQNSHKSHKLYAQLKFHGWSALTGLETDRYGDQNWRWDPIEIKSKTLSTAQIKHEGLTINFYHCKGMTPSPQTDQLVGELVKFSCSGALNSFGEYRDLKGDAHLNGQFVGKVIIGTKYQPENENEIVKQQEVAEKQCIMKPLGGDQAINSKLGQSNSNSQSNLDTVQAKELVSSQVKGMEKHLKMQLQHLIDSQTKELNKKLEDLERQQRKNQTLPTKSAPQKEKWDIFNVTNVQLPANVHDWRVAHVQAWLAFQVELPAYMEAFQKASVDGMMLLKYVDEVTLTSSLSVSNKLHKAKIMDAIEELKERQEVVEKKANALRKAQLRKAQADHEAEIEKLAQDETAAIAKLERTKEKKAKKAASKKGKSSSHKTIKSKSKKEIEHDKKLNTGIGNEQNQINRVKMERAARLALQKAKAKKDEANSKNQTWKFEYTGTPKPGGGTLNSIWDDETFEKGDKPQIGTADYQKVMETLDILDDGIQQGTYKKMSYNYKNRGVRTLPSNSQPDEVIAALKECMYELSSRLLQIQYYASKKNDKENNDDDLVSCDYSVEEADVYADDNMDLFLEDEPSLSKLPKYENVGKSSSAVLVPTVPTSGDKSIPEEQEDWIAPPPVDDDDDDDEYYDGYDGYDGYAPPPLSEVPPMNNSNPTSNLPKKIIKLIKKDKKTHNNNDNNDKTYQQSRVSLVYNALVNQTNNDASFIGNNNKLTRLKLFGGCESLLRLKLNWSQFDSLWTRLDSFRTGDLDLKEFTSFFGNLSEFETNEGIQGLTTIGNNISNEMKELTKVLYSLCDVMRHAGFTVIEMFQSFDRDGSNEISLNEFCSLLRLIVGPTFDKKLVYRSLLVLDTDRNKCISKEEFMSFIYKTWKQQMDDLDYRRCCFDEKKQSDIIKINEIVNERVLIKSAIKKNFPRELRNAFEAAGTTLSGPFSTLFNDNINDNIKKTGLGANQLDSTKSLPNMAGTGNSFSSTAGSKRLGSPSRSGSPNRPHSPSKIDNIGQIIRVKIRPPGANSPSRNGEILTLPHIMNMNNSLEGALSSEATKAILIQSTPIGL
jgi:hypothetical protein